MSKLDIHGCVAAVRAHFYGADYLHLSYTLPVEAYSLNRTLQYRLCAAWNRFEHVGAPMNARECVMLAEAWLVSAPEHTKPMFVNAAWCPGCANCGYPMAWHHSHPENTPRGDPPDRWVCDDGRLYEPIEYKLPPFGPHPVETSR